MSQSQKEFYVQILNKNVCEIKYINPYDNTKTELTSTCTLLSSYTNLRLVPSNLSTTEYAMYVFDVDKNQWKLIPLSNIVSFKILTGTTQEKPIKITSAQYARVMLNKKDMDIQPTMVIKHKLVSAQPINTPVKRATISSRQRWMYHWLELCSCRIVFQTLTGELREINASLEEWVLNIINIPKPKISFDDALIIMQVVNLNNNNWEHIYFDNIISFSTPVQTYVFKKSHVTSPITNMGPKVSKLNSEDFVKRLQSGICIVEFEKADGTMCTMTCSLNNKIIIALNLASTGIIYQPTDVDIIKVVDIDKKDWRTIRISKIRKFVYGPDIDSGWTDDSQSTVQSVLKRKSVLHAPS